MAGNRGDGPRLLLASLGAVHGLSHLPEITRDRLGKPWFPAHPEWHFNLTHSGSLLLCALSDHPVGVDLEQIRPRSERLMERCLTVEELVWCRQAADPWPRFYVLWTRRESACKRTGRGLTFPISAISVPLPPESECGGILWQGYDGPGWTASLCGRGPLPPDILWLDSSSLPV